MIINRNEELRAEAISEARRIGMLKYADLYDPIDMPEYEQFDFPFITFPNNIKVKFAKYPQERWIAQWSFFNGADYVTTAVLFDHKPNSNSIIKAYEIFEKYGMYLSDLRA